MIATLAGDPRRAAEAAVLIRAGKDFSRLSLYPPPDRKKTVHKTHTKHMKPKMFVCTYTHTHTYIYLNYFVREALVLD